MRIMVGLRAHAGLWSLVALLAAGMVFVLAAARPVTSGLEDQALRHMVAEAPYQVRDITMLFLQEPRAQPASAEQALASAQLRLPAPLLSDRDHGWAYQRTSPLSLTGDQVSDEPDGWAPAIRLMHHTGLETAATLVEGSVPANGPGGDGPGGDGPGDGSADGAGDGSADEVIEVMAAAEVAEVIGLRVGEEYQLAQGAMRSGVSLSEAAQARTRLPVRLTGLFEADDAAAPVWDDAQPLLQTSATGVATQPSTLATTAVLATDQDGIDAVRDRDDAVLFELETAARTRLEAQRLDAAWADRAASAVAELRTSPRTRELVIQTRLDELIDEFNRLVAASRALMAVVLAGIVGTVGGLLLLAARLAVARRDTELRLLRARGASMATVAGRLAAEAVLVVAPAAGAGWLITLLVVDRLGRAMTLPATATALLAVVAAVLAVPVAATVEHRSVRCGAAVGTDLAPRPAAPARRAVPARLTAGPARLTAELSVVLLAGLGILLVQRRGLTQAGTDPYLSAVPVLVALAGGLVALRIYPWPLRALSGLTARLRGAVGFLGLARAGRAGPAAALPLVVLVLAVAVGGFAGAVRTAVASARDAAAMEAVGAHARVSADELPAGADEAVAAVPGVTLVATSHGGGVVRAATPIAGRVEAVAVDMGAYRQVLAAAGAAARLPDALVSASPGAGPIPVLAAPQLAGFGTLTVHFGDAEYPAVVVGDVTVLPGPGRGPDVVLVPSSAVLDLPPADELLVAGADADPTALRAAAAAAGPAAAGPGGGAGRLTVTTLAQQRGELEESAFNPVITVVFVTGTAAAAVAGLLAVALMLVMQAAARGRALSLLRTAGLSMRQARALLLVELLPLTALAVAVGVAVGATLPLLLGPALGLAEYTAGQPVSPDLDPGILGLLAGLVVVFTIGGAVTQAAANRRLGLGPILRVD